MQREKSQPTPLEKRRSWEIIRRSDQMLVKRVAANTVTEAWKQFVRDSACDAPNRDEYDVRRVIDGDPAVPAGLRGRFAP